MEKSNKNSTATIVLLCLGIVLIAVIIGLIVRGSGGFAIVVPSGQSQTAAAVDANLATADTFGVLSSTYTNSTLTTINGDLGYTTGPSIPATVSGTTHTADGAYTQAGIDQDSALSTLNGEGCDFNFNSPTDLSLLAQPLAPGVYCITAAASIGTGGITLTNSGPYLFRIDGALTTVANSPVTLAAGASACNVFWTPTAATTLGANSTFVGTDIDDSGITLGNNVTWLGGALAFAGTVTTDTDTISVPVSCSAPVPNATLHVIKLVVNTNGGTAVASNFILHVKLAGNEVAGSPAAGTSTPGTAYSLSAGTYAVSEDASSSYTESFTGDCDTSGNITLASGDNKICTIVNTDIPPLPPAPATSFSGGEVIAVPLIGITKVPTPLALSGGAGPVTYNYTVWNVGKLQPLSDVTVTDDKCSQVTLISGDTNGNGLLDPNETWKYSCTTTLSTTTTNTAVATGYSLDPYRQAAIATAIVTVVVGAPLPPPLINIVKVPSRLTPFPYGGGPVTYTYTVTNPGIVPLGNVTVTDNTCAPVSAPTGDTNGNGLLDPNETWRYTCQETISSSTRNIATARGSANGLTAVGYAFATVLVSAPGFPNTGLPPLGDSVSTASPADGQTLSRLEIPAINVDAAIISVGLTPSGAMSVPVGPDDAAWFDLGPYPGEIGSAVIAGHYGWKDNIPAVFDNLSKLQPGDKIYVEDAMGSTTTFVVREVKTYAENDIASGVFTSSDGKAHLNLITCKGIWNATQKSYSDRLVVFADEE